MLFDSEVMICWFVGVVLLIGVVLFVGVVVGVLTDGVVVGLRDSGIEKLPPPPDEPALCEGAGVGAGGVHVVVTFVPVENDNHPVLSLYA